MLGLLLGLVGAACGADAPRLLPASGIGGAWYDPAYDWAEFFAVTDGRNFQVVMAGAPFPARPAEAVKQALLPVMQAAKPRPNLTFTYADPPEPQHPFYRMVLVFDAANDLTASSVCAGEVRHKPPLRERPFNLFAVYCRNERALSQTTAWSDATGPDDPRLQALLAQLFLVLFDETRRWRVPVPVRPGMRF